MTTTITSNPSNEQAHEPGPAPRRRHLGAKVLTVLCLAGASLGTLASGAGAMSPYVKVGQHRAGDCVVTSGAAYDAGRGWAFGAGMVQCSYRHASTAVTVRLWRWNGTQWTYFPSTVHSTMFYNSFGLGNRELDSGGVCGGGYTYWTTEVDYSISGVGSGAVYDPVQGYSPGAC